MQEGELIDGYRVLRKLGQGAMGVVFEATHEQTGRRAALKVLHPDYTSDPELAQRFFNEARAAGMIAHGGVVQVYGFGKGPDGSAYFAMEYLAGESLRQRLKAGGGKLGENMLNIAGQIAGALAAAHAKKIVHRDLKPDNIMLVPDASVAGGERVKILDFGIAKLLEAEDVGVRTAAGTAMGTPTYMSPEQFTGADAVTDRADVYSLGVILYHFVAGRPPFQAKGPGDMLMQHLNAQPIALQEIDRGVNPELAALIHRMLAKQPTERPSMAEVAAKLQELGAAPLPEGASLVAPDVLPEPEPEPEAPRRVEPGTGEGYEGTMVVRGPKGPSRLLIVVGGAAVVAVLGGVGLWALLRPDPHQTPAAPAPRAAAPDEAAPKQEAPASPGVAAPGDPGTAPAPAKDEAPPPKAARKKKRKK